MGGRLSILGEPHSDLKFLNLAIPNQQWFDFVCTCALIILFCLHSNTKSHIVIESGCFSKATGLRSTIRSDRIYVHAVLAKSRHATICPDCPAHRLWLLSLPNFHPSQIRGSAQQLLLSRLAQKRPIRDKRCPHLRARRQWVRNRVT